MRRDGDDLEVWSRAGKPLDRYFPELAFPPGRYVLDGEILIAGADGGEEFGLLQQRIHPAASRIALLAEEIPAVFAAFDLLAAGRREPDGAAVVGAARAARGDGRASTRSRPPRTRSAPGSGCAPRRA